MDIAFKEGEEKYKLIFENTVESIAVIQDNKIQICNSYAQKMTGYTIEEMMKRPFLSFIHQDDKENALKSYNERLLGKKKYFKKAIQNNSKKMEILFGLK